MQNYPILKFNVIISFLFINRKKNQNVLFPIIGAKPSKYIGNKRNTKIIKQMTQVMFEYIFDCLSNHKNFNVH